MAPRQRRLLICAGAVEGLGTYGMYAWIAEELTKAGGGAPTTQPVKELLAKIDEDGEWFPGKQYGAKRGRKRQLWSI